ncbi:MAG: hypothetical protein AAFX57_18355, partial [Bacteroidota bacterium]
MKKFGFIIVCIFACGCLKAQEAGKINVFGGFVLGTAAGIDDDGSSKTQLGVNLGVEYFITNEISAAPSYSSFFESEAGADDDIDSVDIDVNEDEPLDTDGLPESRSDSTRL